MLYLEKKVFVASYLKFEFYQDGSWRRLGIFYDGEPLYVEVKSGESITLVTRLNGFFPEGAGSTGRIISNGYISEPFTLTSSVKTNANPRLQILESSDINILENPPEAMRLDY